MTAKPLTSEAIALTEKKMDMTLGIIVSYTCFTRLFWFSSSFADNQLVLADDIIKMSRTNTTKPKKQRVSVSTSLSDHLVFISAFVSLIWNEILIFIICFLQNRSQKFSNNVAQDKSAKIQKFMDTRSSMRQVLITILSTYEEFDGFFFVLVDAEWYFFADILMLRGLLLVEDQIFRETSSLWQLRQPKRPQLLLFAIGLSIEAEQWL